MAKFTYELLETLEKLSKDEFAKFKWYLKQPEILKGFSGIPAVRLDNVERQDTVDRMVQKYRDPGALKLTLVVLRKLDRNDLVQHLQNSSSGPKGIMSRTHIFLVLGLIAGAVISAVLSSSSKYEDKHPPIGAHDFKTHYLGAHRKEYSRAKVELKWAKKFAVEVTLDPDTAHPNLILSDDYTQVHHGKVREKLPINPKRFTSRFNVLGKQYFSSGPFYYEVQVKGKIAWTVGVATESINTKQVNYLSPKDGFWALWLRNGNSYSANDNPGVRLPLKSQPERVGVFVDYEEGLVSFYDVDAADHLYSFTDCSFTEKLYPCFNPCGNGGGTNSAPLIISPVNHQLKLKKRDFSNEKDKYGRKHAELKSIQQFLVEVTLDPDTAHPNLILSDDYTQVHHGDVRKKLPIDPKRFTSRFNVLGKQYFSSGQFYYEVQVKGKIAWNLGVATELINTKQVNYLSPQDGVWALRLRNGNSYSANDNPAVRLSLKSQPERVGVFVDYEEGLVSFYDVDAADHLYSFTDCSFTEKLYPCFNPCGNGGGTNSAPLIISPVNHQLKLKKRDLGNQKDEYERKHAELKSIQQFLVEVTLDPDTAHPNLILSQNGKQVHHGDVSQKLPYNPKRFTRFVNVLGKQSFSTGRFYFEVRVEGKTEWTVGIASELTDRKGNVTLSPENDFWTICLRKGDEYDANDSPFKRLSLKSPPKKVGVFVDYEMGLVSFYDAEAADHLYSFTGCSFIGKLYPFFCPEINGGGRNSIPLIICPVNHRN